MRMSGPGKVQEQKVGTVVQSAKKFCLLLLVLGLNLTLAGAQQTVPVQPERESGRSRVSVDAALRAGIFKASGSFDPMGWSVGARRSFPRP